VDKKLAKLKKRGLLQGGKKKKEKAAPRSEENGAANNRKTIEYFTGTCAQTCGVERKKTSPPKQYRERQKKNIPLRKEDSDQTVPTFRKV